MLQSFFVAYRKFRLNDSASLRALSCLVCGRTHVTVRQTAVDEAIHFSHWRGGHSEKATHSEGKHLEPRPKICLLDHPSASADSKVNHKFHILVRSERVEVPQQTRFSQRLLFMEVKNQHFFPPLLVLLLPECMLYECVMMKNQCIFAGGGLHNWLVSAKCGRGLTSMFQSASWVGRCRMIHQMLG